MAPPESPGARSLTNELNVQMNGASADLLISHERIGVLGFWGIEYLCDFELFFEEQLCIFGFLHIYVV